MRLALPPQLRPHIVHVLAQLDRIEEEVVQTKFPLDFTDRVYTLRQHVDYVRAQLRRQSEPHAKD